MTSIRRWLQKLRSVNLSNRQAAAFAVASGALLVALMAVWLTMSTRTALLDRQLEQLDRRQTDLTDEINKTWTEIGSVTAPRAMEDRARRLGFQPVDKIEYLVTTPDAVVTATVTAKNEVTGTLVPPSNN